jgi:hypothetical protein
LAEAATQLRSFEGSEKQAAQNQTVSGPAAKGACLIPDILAEDGQRFDCATWLHKARALPKEDLRREVEKELTGKETEASELSASRSISS